MRAARLDPSALSPSEHEAYEAWIADLEAHLGRLQRGLRIGEMLAFIRKRTVVDREAEITAFFGNGSQQQNLGIEQFLAILRLLAHARTCSTLTRDHIFIQTSPLVLIEPKTLAGNPFFRSRDALQEEPIQPPPRKLVSSSTPSLKDIAATRKRAPAPPPPTAASKPVLSPIAASPGAAAGSESPSSLITPIAGQNPFRRREANVSAQSTEVISPASMARLPPTPPESTWTAKSPPLPPRPPQRPTEPPPKHVSQQFQYQRLAGEPSSSALGGPTPSVIKPYSVPAPGPTSIDIISSSAVQPSALQAQSTGQSNASSTTATRLVHQNTGGNRKASSVHTLSDLNVRLLGSSHIGIDSMRLRKHPSPASSALAPQREHLGPRYSPSSDDLAAPQLSKNRSDSSLSSLSGMLPRTKRGTTVSSGSVLTASSTSPSRDRTLIADLEDGSSSEEILSSEYTAKPSDLGRSKTVTGRSGRPPPPPPARRRPESLYVSRDPMSRSQKLVFGTEPSGVHSGPFTATSISSGPAGAAAKGRPMLNHARSASLSSASVGPSMSHNRPSRQYRPEGMARHASTNTGRSGLAVDALLHKGRDVSQEWLEKARAAAVPRLVPGQGEDKESLMAGREQAQQSDDDALEEQPRSVQERRRELERLRTETEPGWSRLD